MTTDQIPVRRCQYCGSDDLGLGWQHGEAIATFKKHGLLGKPAALPDLPPLRGRGVSVGGEPHKFPPIRIISQIKDNLWR